MKMYLQKGRAFDRRDEFDMSGLELARFQGRTFISSVDNESPAAAAGIKPEDVILKVGDQSASAMDIYDIRDLLKSGDGKEIKMAIKRGDEEKVVSFKLKERI
jgi:C-terminal processing protease CtpA/Prc